jgi:hypothetical protein
MIDREKKGKPLFSPEQVDKGEEAWRNNSQYEKKREV